MALLALGQVVREELLPEKSGESWTHRSQLRSEEAIYGLGERSVPLNLRLARDVTDKGEVTPTPKTFRMWNYDAAGKYDTGADPMYICIPLYWGLHHQGSYLVFYENSFDARFTFSDVATATFEGGALRYYIAVGSPAQLLERYTELTGRSPLPPRWALGYHQSHWGYETEDAVRSTYQGFEAHNLPLSVIHLDIDVQVGFRAFTIDPDRFPNLRGFIQELLEHGVQFVTILNPGVKLSRKSNLFLEGRVLDAFCRLANGQLVVAPVWPGWCVFPDFTNPVVLPQKSLQGKHLTLHLYPPTEETVTSMLYTDAGDGYEASRLDHFLMRRVAGGLDLDWASEGDFPFPYESIQVHVHGMELQEAWVDREAASVQSNQISVLDRFLHLHMR